MESKFFELNPEKLEEIAFFMNIFYAKNAMNMPKMLFAIFSGFSGFSLKSFDAIVLLATKNPYYGGFFNKNLKKLKQLWPRTPPPHTHSVLAPEVQYSCNSRTI